MELLKLTFNNQSLFHIKNKIDADCTVTISDKSNTPLQALQAILFMYLVF